MLTQASNMLPSLYAGDGMGVIDATEENTFSANINGTSPAVAYQCAIYKNNASSDLVYDTGIITLTTPFYGADASGNIVPFTYVIPSNDSTQVSYTTMENGYIYGYKYILTLWWDYNASALSEGSIDSYEYVFYAKATPTLSINAFGTGEYHDTLPIIDSRSATWTATYAQTNDVGITWFQWTLALADDHTDIVDQTKKIYSNSSLGYSYDGLTNGTGYAIKVTLQNEDGVSLSSNWVDFYVDYETISIQSAIIQSVTDYGGILTNWGDLQYITGTPNNSFYQYLEYLPAANHICVELLATHTISFTSSQHFNLEIPIDAEQVWSGYIAQDSNEIYYASGTDKNGSAYYMRLSHTGSVDGLMPSNTLVPSNTLKPHEGEGGHFLLDINGNASYQYDTEPVANNWYVVRMSPSGINVSETDFRLDMSSLIIVQPTN